MKKSALEIYCEAVLEDIPGLEPVIDNFMILAESHVTRKAAAHAERLLIALMQKHYPENTQFEPLKDDIIGLLDQIDNLTTGLVRRQEPIVEKPPAEMTLKSFGYAPGNYIIRCMDPDHAPVGHFSDDRNFGDKRAWRCQPCAQRLLDAHNASARTPVDPSL